MCFDPVYAFPNWILFHTVIALFSTNKFSRLYFLLRRYCPFHLGNYNTFWWHRQSMFWRFLWWSWTARALFVEPRLFFKDLLDNHFKRNTNSSMHWLHLWYLFSKLKWYCNDKWTRLQFSIFTSAKILRVFFCTEQRIRKTWILYIEK